MVNTTSKVGLRVALGKDEEHPSRRDDVVLFELVCLIPAVIGPSLCCWSHSSTGRIRVASLAPRWVSSRQKKGDTEKRSMQVEKERN